jgi:TonB-dependent starch-binding outer membrane protein SusC
VKLREVSVGVNVPTPRRSTRWASAQRSVRLSVTGRNLAMWTNYSGLDPEVANFGAAAIRNNLDIGPYPPSRSFFFNISVGF